jgi:type VI secretion system secreted protein VgrG
MAKDVYTITCSALPDSARVAGFRGVEAISRTYEFHVYILLGPDGNDLDLDDVVGSKAKLALDRNDFRTPFLFHGIFCAFELVHEFDGRSLFHAVLVPQLWQLTQTFHSRIWTKKSIKDIIGEVLDDGGLSATDYDFRLTHTYKPEEHVCQYHESDFDFISRWMEREGIYYYFEQGEDGEKLVITDSKGKQDFLDKTPVRFFAQAGHDGSAGEALHTFTCKHHALPATVKLKDYDYAKPTLDVSGEAAVSRSGFGEIFVYGHRFFTPDEGKRLAKIRAEELLARKAIYRGTGTEFHLRSGYFFKLEDHPRSAFDKKYLAYEVEHVANQAISTAEMRAYTDIETDKVYQVEVKAIPADTQFRPVRATEWPRIYGHENGTVCGPADSEYAQIDDHGRYNVKFKFDESNLKNGKASTWVRMMQPHGGNPEGFHFPLRKGTEVVFSFHGGDPDRPVIAGVVPDTANPSPITSANHTRNIIHTGGDNHFELEDLAGQQRITLSTPHAKTHIMMGNPQGGDEFIAKTEGNSLHHTDQDHDQVVGKDKTIKVGGKHDESVTGDKKQHVEGEVEHEHDKSHKFTIGDDWEVTVGEDKKEIVIGQTKEIFIGDKQETTIGTTTELMVGSETSTKIADSTETIIGSETGLTISEKSEVTIADSTEITIGSSFELTVADKKEITVGTSLGLFVGAQVEVRVGPAMSIFSSAEIEVGPESAEAKADKAKLEGLESEMKGVHQSLAGAKDAIHGLKQASVGLKALEAGVVNHDLALRLVNAGLSNTAAGLTLME